MNLYQLIQSCQKAKSHAEIRRLLHQHKDNNNIKELFRLMLDKSIIYNIKAVPDRRITLHSEIQSDNELVTHIHHLLDRDLRGDALRDAVRYISSYSDIELAQVLNWILARQNPAKVGKSFVNVVWPGLIRVQEYMGAVPGTDKALKNLPWATGVNVQHKIDGMTLIVHYNDGSPVELRTRQGQDITKYFPGFMSRQKTVMGVTGFTGMVHHEGLVWDSEEEGYLDRQTGNGLINKAVKNGTIGGIVDDSIHSVILDCKDDNFLDAPQHLRYSYLRWFMHDTARRVHQTCIYDLQEAREYAKKLIREGQEGVICKDPLKPFKNGKPTFNVKIKNEFCVELKCIDWKAHSKDSNKIGSLVMRSDDEILEVNIGSGLSDFHRSVDAAVYIGCIFEVTAESIIKSKSKKKPSLYLPRFNTGKHKVLPIREDKVYADSYQQVKDQEQASKEALL